MKKLGKFLVGSVTLASAVAGAYYLYKNFINKDYTDDFDDFDDEFTDEVDEELDKDENIEKTREYVSIQVNSVNTKSDSKDEADSSTVDSSEEDSNVVEEKADAEETD